LVLPSLSMFSVKLLRDLTVLEKGQFTSSDLFHQIQREYTYHSLSLAYNAQVFPGNYEDFSVVAFYDEKPVLCCYIFTSGTSFRFFNDPAQIFYLEVNPELLWMSFTKTIAFIKGLIQSHNFTELTFYSNGHFVNSFYDKIKSSRIEHFGMIDLHIQSDLIKTNVRKSYKSLINWGFHNLKLQVISGRDVELTEFIKFRDFHIHVAGRTTRSDESWMTQFEMLQQNKAYLVTGYYQDKLVAASYILHGSETAYYGIGVYDRELMAEDLPLSHYTLYFSILHAQKLGLLYFNMGNLDPGESAKSRSIALFKKGFTTFVQSRISYTVSFLKPDSFPKPKEVRDDED